MDVEDDSLRDAMVLTLLWGPKSRPWTRHGYYLVLNPIGKLRKAGQLVGYVMRYGVRVCDEESFLNPIVMCNTIWTEYGRTNYKAEPAPKNVCCLLSATNLMHCNFPIPTNPLSWENPLSKSDAPKTPTPQPVSTSPSAYDNAQPHKQHFKS